MPASTRPPARGTSRLGASAQPVRARWEEDGARRLRLLEAGRGDGLPHVVLLPGLGALGYLLPTVRAVAALGARCTLLDLPGFGAVRRGVVEGSLDAVAAAAAAWVRTLPPAQSVVLAGHSTGAQSALLAALQVQQERSLDAVVLAGPTFAPPQRRLPRLLAAVPAAYRRDSPRELHVVGDFVRGGPELVRLLWSGLRDAPEEHAAQLRTPLVLTSGRQDAFAPASWLAQLGAAAVRAPEVRTVRLPGSHNNPFTHPRLVAAVLVAAAGLRVPDGRLPRVLPGEAGQGD